MSKEYFYHPELDGLRFLAFLLVFIHHAPLLLKQTLLTALHQYGWIGVDLFLCLSAFLFAKLLFAEYRVTGDIHVQNFYVRRALRIWPLYFAFLIFTVIVTFRQQGWDSTLYWRALGMAVFADNILAAFWGYNPFAHAAHLWTISYEEQFYAAIPWLLKKVFKMTLRAQWTIVGFIFAAFSLFRGALIAFNAPHPAIWVLPVAHFEAILGGLVLGLGLLDDLLKKIPEWLLAAMGAILLCLVCALPNVDQISWSLALTYPLVGAGMLLLLASVIGKSWFFKRFLQNRWLVYFGKISYGLYVYHYLAINYGKTIALMLGIFPRRLFVYPLSVFILAFLITILLSVASYQWLEKPFLKFKERFTSIQSRPI